MTSRVLLDTDTLSDILKGKNIRTNHHARIYAGKHGLFTYTAVSVHEILYGLHHKDAKKQLVAAESSFNENELFVPLLEDFKTAGRIRGIARKSGRQLTMDDCLIGAVVARLNLPIVTGNTQHFEAMIVAGLSISLLNWRD